MLEKNLTQILEKDLIKGKWYVGRGRNSNVGYWDGKNFLTIGFKFEVPTIKFEGYYEKKRGCFQPFYGIEKGKIKDCFGKIGWDAHYGKTLIIKDF
ncbi:MAG: hypothetical protein V1660_01935 [archaeon]